MGTHQTHDTTELASFSPKNQKCLSFFLQFSFARSMQTLWEIFSAFSLLVWIDTAQRNQLQPGERNTHLANNTEKRQGWKWEIFVLILTPKRRRFPNNDQTRSDFDNKKVMFPSEDQMRIDFDNQKICFQIRTKWGLILTTKKWGFQMRIKWGLILTTKKKRFPNEDKMRIDFDN